MLWAVNFGGGKAVRGRALSKRKSLKTQEGEKIKLKGQADARDERDFGEFQ